MSDSTSIEYYRRRTAESGDCYGPPEMQEDFAWLASWLQKNVAGREVLEVACGSGHWTKMASVAATGILATDIHWSLLRAARQNLQACTVDFVAADAYSLPLPQAAFDCGMGHYWLSHVPRPDI